MCFFECSHSPAGSSTYGSLQPNSGHSTASPLPRLTYTSLVAILQTLRLVLSRLLQSVTPASPQGRELPVANIGSKLWSRPPGNAEITWWNKGFTGARVQCREGDSGGVWLHMSSHGWWNWEVIYEPSETTRGILCSPSPPKEDVHNELAAFQRRAIKMIKGPEGVT